MRTPRFRSRAFARVRHTTGAILLVIVVTAALFVDLGRPYLWDPGEGRYAETVREMLLTGNWLVPTLNLAGYYDKPPGFFWLVAGAFRLVGPTEWGARLPAALGASLTIAATVLFAWRRVGPAAALGAGAVLATAIQFVALARSVRMDTLLTLTIAGTLFYGYRLWEGADGGADEGEPVTWPLYVLPALGLLIKGPVAVVLPLLVVSGLTLVTGEYGRLRRLRPGVGALVGLGLASTWYVAAAVHAPDYLWTFLWHHNVERFMGTGAGHDETAWYFLWVLPVTFLPWTLFLPGALRHAWRHARRGHDLDLFLLTWVAVVVAFFTLSRAKLAIYVLPAFPPLALLVSTYVVRALRAPDRARAIMLGRPAVVWIAGMLVVSFGTVISVLVRYPAYALQASTALALLIFPLAGIVAVRGRRWNAVPALVLVAALGTQMLFYRVGAGVVNEFNSLRTAADAARELPAAAAVFVYKTRGHSFSFYGQRTVTRVRSPADAAAALASSDPTGLLTKAKYLERIQQHLAEPVCIWWQSPSGRVLLANRPRAGAAERRALLPQASRQNARVAPITSDPPRC